MIQRVVTVKLRDGYADDDSRRQIAAETRRVLAEAHGVLEVAVGLPGDGRTEREWDLCILVKFADMETVEAYRTCPIHRAYADVFLKPLRSTIRVWNFELAQDPSQGSDQRA